jgi:hypothetical protein
LCDLHHNSGAEQRRSVVRETILLEDFMLTALVLVCSLAATPDLANCDHKNALSIMRVPAEFANPAACAMEGQAYVAQTAIGRNLTANESVKVVCVPSATVDTTTIRSLVID